DAGAFQGLNCESVFDGTFTGNGGLGQNHAISNLSVSLFPTIGSEGFVRNLNLSNVAINGGGGGGGSVGALAGINNGTITNVWVGGTINGGSGAGSSCGGLVGPNSGTIPQSHATALVAASGHGARTAVGGRGATNSGTIT